MPEDSKSSHAPDRNGDGLPAPFHHRCLGHGFALLLALLGYLPAWLTYGFANLITPIFVLITFLGRKTSTRKRRGFYYNTEIVFRGRLSRRQRRRLLWSWARHMTHLGIDIARLPRITASNLEPRFDFTEVERLQDAIADKKGVMIVSGHIGVYEYAPHLLSLLGLTVHTIYRESPVVPITDALNRLRTAGGQVLTLRQGAVRQLLRLLGTEKITGIMGDVSVKNSELFMPFLGTDAATNNVAGMLHLKSCAPIVVLTLQRVGRQRYKLCVWDVIRHPKTEDRADDLRLISERINDSLSRAICAYPEQWFWDCRRFRNRPAGEVMGADGMPLQTKPEQVTASFDHRASHRT